MAAAAVEGLAAALPPEPVVLNINVPDRELHDIQGWKRTEVGIEPPRSMATAQLEPRPGHTDAFRVKMDWGDAIELPEYTDGGAVMAGWVSVGWLGRLESVEPGFAAVTEAETRLDKLLS